MPMLSQPKTRWILLSLLGAFCLLDAVIAMQIPAIRRRVEWRWLLMHAEISESLFPQPADIPTPLPEYAAVAQSTLTVMAAACPGGLGCPTPTITLPPTAECPAGGCASATPVLSPTPAITPTPIPERVVWPYRKHEFQLFNNCGPATLSMALKFWGWPGNQVEIAAATKPNEKDKNVMPYELERFINEQTDYGVMVRTGGNLDLLKRLIAAGFPVMIEKGILVLDKNLGWMGHYTFVTGYDDRKQEFTAQDSYLGADTQYPYARIERDWRAFNYHYLLIYPVEREDEARALLGTDADPETNLQNTIQQSWNEIQTRSGEELAFAWYNLGTNYVTMKSYADAAAAFDQASSLGIPWRIIWYQTGPYWAYFYTGRYQSVIDLASATLYREDSLEESWYWRGLARMELGDTQGAIDDWRQALVRHPGFEAALLALQNAGAAAE